MIFVIFCFLRCLFVFIFLYSNAQGGSQISRTHTCMGKDTCKAANAWCIRLPQLPHFATAKRWVANKTCDGASNAESHHIDLSPNKQGGGGGYDVRYYFSFRAASSTARIVAAVVLYKSIHKWCFRRIVKNHLVYCRSKGRARYHVLSGRCHTSVSCVGLTSSQSLLSCLVRSSCLSLTPRCKACGWWNIYDR